MIDIEAIKARYGVIEPYLDERRRRLAAAAEAKAAGWGGISAASVATGLSMNAISRGIAEIESGADIMPGRVRKPGGGAKLLTDKQPGLLDALRVLVEPATRGDPESPLRWVSKGLRSLAKTLKEMGFSISFRKVADLLRELDFSLQANSKVLEGSCHVDRNAQFEYINTLSKEFMAAGQPVVSVDTKKKECVGNYKNQGREWQPEGTPEKVGVYDFIGPLGKISPYGVYDVAANAGWVSVGISHDTAQFAVESLRRWYYQLGHGRYPDMKKLFVCCDGGGSNGYRVKLWKLELQKLASEIGIPITVSHYPPGTSKWNRIEHRMFCHITRNWRSKPLISYDVIVSLIAATTTETGLSIQCEIDASLYEKGIKITKEELAAVNITRDEFHPEWNYTISPLAPST